MSLPNYMGCLMEFLQIFIIKLYENVFQNPELFPTQVSLSPEQSTLSCYQIDSKNWDQLRNQLSGRVHLLRLWTPTILFSRMPRWTTPAILERVSSPLF
jgi:hypothetical protein